MPDESIFTVLRKREKKAASKGKSINYWGRYTEDEKKSFIQAVELYGKDYHKIANFVGTRDYNSIRSWFYRKVSNKKAHNIIPLLPDNSTPGDHDIKIKSLVENSTNPFG